MNRSCAAANFANVGFAAASTAERINNNPTDALSIDNPVAPESITSCADRSPSITNSRKPSANPTNTSADPIPTEIVETGKLNNTPPPSVGFDASPFNANDPSSDPFTGNVPNANCAAANDENPVLTSTSIGVSFFTNANDPAT